MEKTAQPGAGVQKGNTRVEPWVGDVLTKWRLGLKWDKVGSRLSPNPTPGLTEPLAVPKKGHPAVCFLLPPLAPCSSGLASGS